SLVRTHRQCEHKKDPWSVPGASFRRRAVAVGGRSTAALTSPHPLGSADVCELLCLVLQQNAVRGLWLQIAPLDHVSKRRDCTIDRRGAHGLISDQAVYVVDLTAATF